MMCGDLLCPGTLGGVANYVSCNCNGEAFDKEKV
jgi:hypothetical protein